MNKKRIFIPIFSDAKGLVNLTYKEVICKHDEYCIIKVFKESLTCDLNDVNKCQTHKFYNRYKKIGKI